MPRRTGEKGRVFYTPGETGEVLFLPKTGVHRETATTVLDELKAQGLVEIGRKRISILDRDGLRLLAGE